MTENTIQNSQLQLAHDFVQYTGKHIFLTGKAGTGKTTFLHRLKEKSPKRMIVVAPTGVAAINAGGVTIHSFFQISFGPQVPGFEAAGNQGYKRFSREKRNIIKSLDLLVIDEISMVRADLLDGIDETLRRFRNNNLPFGGVQLLMIGDLQQLAPVVKDEDWDLLRNHYQTAFFFGSKALQKTNYTTIVLHHVYRQSDPHFIGLLNKIRDNRIDGQATEMLNKRYIPGFDPGDKHYIILTTHNAKARQVNDSKLSALKGKAVRYNAEIGGNFPEYTYPTDEDLLLKPEAQVMFVKNDPNPEKRYFNGKIGKVISLDQDGVVVKCSGETDPINVAPLEWQNIKYSIDDNTKQISEKVDGVFIQIPLKLAWAITIHKSQGLTFDKAIIDSEQAFAHGQVYVALSRCRSLEGLVLSSPFSPFSLKTDTTIERFNQDAEKKQPGVEELMSSKRAYQEDLLTGLFNFSELQKYIFYFHRVLNENRQGFQPTYDDSFQDLSNRLRDEVVAVAEKFQKQIGNYLLQNADAETNEALQQRIQKAATYFSDKLNENVLGPLNNFSFETDNKEIRKTINRADEQLREAATFKLACLQACTNGFKVKEYLAEKAKASLEQPGSGTRRKREKVAVSREINNPGLYETIKQWRDEKADEINVSHFMVLPLKTIRALSNQVPSNMEEMQQVHGMGKRKLNTFGEELLALINAYREENEVVFTEPPVRKRKVKVPKQDTRKQSLQLWKELQNIEKVAKHRQLARSTIEGHLAHFVGLGELPVTDFIEKEKLDAITAFFENHNDLLISEAKAKLGDKFTYGDLKFARQYIMHIEQQNLKKDEG